MNESIQNSVLHDLVSAQNQLIKKQESLIADYKTMVEIQNQLVEKQNALIKHFNRFSSSMPFCMGDIIEGYDEKVQEIEILFEDFKQQK